MPRADLELPELLRNYLRFGAQRRTLTPPHEVLLLREWKTSIQKTWREHLGGKFWFGPDIPVIEEVIIPPLEDCLVPVAVNPEELPVYVGSYGHDCAKTTTRSRFAQLGLEVSPNAGRDIATYYKNGESLMKVTNYALRPIRIKAGQAICYQYFENERMLTGVALNEALGRSIQIEGKEGVDWKKWAPSGPLLLPGSVVGPYGIEFMTDPASESYIPEGDEPMELDDGPAENHNRGSVDAYLKRPVPETNRFILIINETIAQIALDESVHGICDMSLTPKDWPFVHDRFRQLNSVGVKGAQKGKKNTYGHLRGEFFVPALNEYRSNSILIHFFSA